MIFRGSYLSGKFDNTSPLRYQRGTISHLIPEVPTSDAETSLALKGRRKGAGLYSTKAG